MVHGLTTGSDPGINRLPRTRIFGFATGRTQSRRERCNHTTQYDSAWRRDIHSSSRLLGSGPKPSAGAVLWSVNLLNGCASSGWFITQNSFLAKFSLNLVFCFQTLYRLPRTDAFIFLQAPIRSEKLFATGVSV